MFGRDNVKFYLRCYNSADKIIGDDISFPISKEKIENFSLPKDTAYVLIHDGVYYSMCEANSIMIYIGNRMSHEEYRTGGYEIHSAYERAYRRDQIGWPHGDIPDFCYICKSKEQPKDITMVAYLNDNDIVVKDEVMLKNLIVKISEELSKKDEEMTEAGLRLGNYGSNDIIRRIGLDYNKKSI